MPVSEKFADYANSIKKELFDKGIRVEADFRPEKIGFKIREAQLEKIPYMIIVGEKEELAGTLSVRKRGQGDIGEVTKADFIAMLEEDINNKKIW